MEISKIHDKNWATHLKWNCGKLRQFIQAHLTIRKHKESSSLNGPAAVVQECQTVEHTEEVDQKIPLAYPDCDLYIWMRSCESETIIPLEGALKGEIPKWIKGSLYRNGPGKQRYEHQIVNHLFDAAGLLHKFSICDGKVTYQSRYVKSKSYLRNVAAKRLVVPEFTTPAAPDPCKTIFQKISSLFVLDKLITDNAMISIYPLGDELYAFSESPFIHSIDPLTLDTTGRENMMDIIGVSSQSSHPHIQNNGEAFSVGQICGITGASYAIIHYPAPSSEECASTKTNCKTSVQRARIVTRVPCSSMKKPSYMHSFSITESFYILVEQPLLVSLKTIFKHLMNGKPLVQALRWREIMTRFRIISRKTGEEIPIIYHTDPFFFLHTINAFEWQDHLIIDICCYKDPQMLDCMYIEALKNAQSDPNYATLFRGRPKRFVMPLKPKVESIKNLNAFDGSSSKAYWEKLGESIFIEPEELSPLGCETPRIHYERFNGKPYRYFYAISSDVDAKYPGALIKVDTVEKKHWTFTESNLYASEPVFIPHPNAQKEDDGVVLSSLIWGGPNERRAGLIVLDASTFTELGRAEFNTSSEVPKCLHGYFLPKQI